jgi:DNA-directed RNA polymerase specialized sigma24 family protein
MTTFKGLAAQTALANTTRKAVELRKEGLTVMEIAKQLDVSVNTVQDIMAKQPRRLRERFGGNHAPDAHLIGFRFTQGRNP